MKQLTMPGIISFSACGRMMKPIFFAIGQAERVGCLVLAARDRLQAAADGLGDVGGGEQRHADQRAQQLVDGDAVGRNSGSMTEAMNSTVISGTPRTNSMKPIEA